MDDGALEAVAEALADAIEQALPAWVERTVERVVLRGQDVVPAPVRDEARVAGQAARDEVGPRVRALLLADIDEQPGTPLTILREAVAYPTAVLLQAGIPPVERDDFSAERFPSDIYDLTPANFRDISEEAGELGVAWGAAKAWTHRRRHERGSRHEGGGES